MADSFAMERFRARMLPPAKPAPVYVGLPTEERAQLLMRAVTMAEIRAAAQRCGLTFHEAYQERARLYRKRPLSDWPGIRFL